MYLYYGPCWGCGSEQNSQGSFFRGAYILDKEADNSETNRPIQWLCCVVSATEENSGDGR